MDTVAAPRARETRPCRPFWRSGARYSALPHCSLLQSAAPDHLELPPRASRCASTSTTRPGSVPLLLLPPVAALARAPAARELQSSASHARCSGSFPRSLSSSPKPWTASSNSADTTPAPPEPCGNGQKVAGAQVHGTSPFSYKRTPRAPPLLTNCSLTHSIFPLRHSPHSRQARARASPRRLAIVRSVQTLPAAPLARSSTTTPH